MSRMTATAKHRVPDGFLHVYAQYIQHGHAVIRGTRPALLRLRQAVDDALASGEGHADLLATDGEGYGLVVVASSTVAGIGQPEYVCQLEYRAFEAAALRWGKLNEPVRHWDTLAAEDNS